MIAPYFEKSNPSINEIVGGFQSFLESSEIIRYENELDLIMYTVYLINEINVLKRSNQFDDVIKNKLKSLYELWKSVDGEKCLVLSTLYVYTP
jgi:hypothetical protein